MALTMRFLKNFIAIVFVLLSTPTNAQLGTIPFSGAPVPVTSFTSAWQSLQVGAGGLLNNIWVATSDGTMLTSTNTAGAYLYRTTGNCAGADTTGGFGTSYAAPCWEQLFTQTSAPQSLTQVTQINFGVVEIDGCNNNTNTAYAFTQGNLYVTTNLLGSAASRRWTQTALATTIGGNQAFNAGTGRTIGCDPANPNIVYAANNAALNVSANGGASFATVSGVGTFGTLPSLIAFDPTSTTQSCSQFSGSPTCTKHLWVFTDGTGVYESYNGGSSFTLTSSGPTTGQATGCGSGGACFSMREDKFGQLWAVIGDTKIYKYVPNGTAGGGTWSNVAVSTTHSSTSYFALDPTASTAGSMRIAASSYDGSFALSTNGGGAFTASSDNPQGSSGSPAWFANANQDQGFLPQPDYNIQDMTFDTSGNLRIAAGIGVWKIASASVSVTASWQADSVGIEQLVNNHVDTPPGSSPVVVSWDRAVFLVQNPDTFPAHYFPDIGFNPSTTQSVQAGWALDWPSLNPLALTVTAGTQNTVNASSTDGGNTWSLWATNTPTGNLGGNIAASTSTNWVITPAQGTSTIYNTVTGAASAWGTTTASGVGNTAATLGSGFSHAADRITANTFCLYDSNGAIYSSTNSGATYTKVVNAGVTNTGFYNHALKSVPGWAATFYLTGGNQGGGSTSYQMYKITKTTNECDTTTLVNANFTNIFGMGYGAPKPGGNGFPTIYWWGWNNSVLGTYEIDNGGTTASLINVPSSQQTWPNNVPDFVKDVSGDINVYGRVYVGYAGTGVTYIDKADACPWVNFSNVTPNESFTGTVNLQATASGKPQVTITGVSFFLDGVLIGTQTTPSGGAGTTISPYVYTQSWTTSGSGNHLLTVATAGNGCTVNSFTGSISGTSGTVSSGTNPTSGQILMFAGQTVPQQAFVTSGGASFSVSATQSASSKAMVAASSMFTVPVTTH